MKVHNMVLIIFLMLSVVLTISADNINTIDYNYQDCGMQIITGEDTAIAGNNVSLTVSILEVGGNYPEDVCNEVNGSGMILASDTSIYYYELYFGQAAINVTSHDLYNASSVLFTSYIEGLTSTEHTVNYSSRYLTSIDVFPITAMRYYFSNSQFYRYS